MVSAARFHESTGYVFQGCLLGHGMAEARAAQERGSRGLLYILLAIILVGALAGLLASLLLT